MSEFPYAPEEVQAKRGPSTAVDLRAQAQRSVLAQDDRAFFDPPGAVAGLNL